MCGICGIIGTSPPVIAAGVHAMMDGMVHRGPDDAGYELLTLGRDDGGPYAGFGFRRLAILDLSASGHQPMFNTNTGDCLIFNGEIYNFRSLRSELQCRGLRFRSTSDTEVLLQALSTFGEAALEKIQGMYALAFFEARTRRILLARDPLGIKPLYVSALPDRFVFGSEIRVVRASGLVPESLDIGGVASMLAYGAVQSPRTVFENIRAFPAGTAEWIDAGVIAGRPRAAGRRFWHFPQRTTTDVDLPEAATTVQRLLRDSVLRHLVADVPVGVFLSAGVDSTILASFAREYTPQVTAFTVGFGEVHGEDEIALASSTARDLGIKHVAVQLDAENIPAKWHDWIEAMDSPSIDGFNTYVVSHRLAAEGVVVGLSGLGADELFGGYPSFQRSPRLSRLLRALAFIPPGARSGFVRRLGAVDARKGAFEKMADIVAGDGSVAGVARGLRRAVSDSSLAALNLTAGKAGLRPDYIDADARLFEPVLDGDAFNTVSRLELVHYMGDTLLRDTDANSMRHSLEVRVPFLDLPLVEFVSGLPGRVKSGGGQRAKALLRESCSSVLSSEITNRPKTGFSLPIDDWMRGEMRDSCQAAIDRVAQVPFINAAEVHRIWGAFVADERSLHWSRPMALVVLGSSIG